jgi:hypothetical protein
MNIYSIADMTRMVLHRKGWTHQKLADEIAVTAKQVQKLLYVPESKWSRVPKGGKEVENIFLEIYPNPVPADQRPLSDAVDKIAWLKRNKTKYKDDLRTEIVHWAQTFALFVSPDNLSDEAKYAYYNLEGHVYFALACDFVDADREVEPYLGALTTKEALRRAILAWMKALQSINSRQQPHVQARYEHLVALTVFNLGAASFNALKEGLTTRKELVELFESSKLNVVKACEFFYNADPRDPRTPFNMACWYSAIESLPGCKKWFGRLVEANPEFADVHNPHMWMRKSMTNDPDFNYLVEHLDEIMPPRKLVA